MERAAYCPTSMLTNIGDLMKRTHDDEAELQGIEDVPFGDLVGSMLCLSCHTRPDIAFGVSVFTRFVENSSRLHWKAGKIILRYLPGTSDHGIVVGSVEPVVPKESEIESQITAYCASDVSDRKSTVSYLLLLNCGTVTSKPYKQKCDSGISTEAEYIALSQFIRELRYLRKFMNELGVDTGTAVVYEDNQECKR